MNMTNSRIGPLAALALMALMSNPAGAETPTGPRDFILKDQGSLRLEVPKTWRSEKIFTACRSGSTRPGRPPFQILMTAFQPRTRTKLSDDLKSIPKVVEGAAAQAKKESVETDIPVRPLKAPHVAGYYISVTDKSPRRGDYKFMNQGLTRIGPIHMSFTILTNDATEKTMATAMAVVRSGSFKKAPAAQAEADNSIPKAHVIVVSKRESGFHLTVPVSRLAMTIPGKTFEQAEAGQGAGSKSARYFYLRDPLRNLFVSGWFESSQDFKGVKRLWTKEVA